MWRDWLSRRWPGPALVVAALLSVVVSVASPTPWPLPGVALGSPAVLDALRALAFFLPLLVGVVVIARGFSGELPSQLSDRGLGYAGEQERESRETINDLSEAVLMTQMLIDDVEARLRALEKQQGAQYSPDRGSG